MRCLFVFIWGHATLLQIILMDFFGKYAIKIVINKKRECMLDCKVNKVSRHVSLKTPQSIHTVTRQFCSLDVLCLLCRGLNVRFIFVTGNLTGF